MNDTPLPVLPVVTADPLEAAIGLLYQAVTDSSRWEPFLQTLCDAFTATVAHFLITNHNRAAASFSMLWGAEASLLDDFFTYMDQDPRMPVGQAHPGRPLGCHLTLGPEVWHAGGMFQHFFRPNGMDDSLSVTIPLEGATAVGIALVRPLGAPSFDTGDLARFNQLVPHVRRAGFLVLRFLALEGERWVALGALDQLALGVAVTDAEGHLLHANLMARRILEARDGVLVLHNQLWGNTPEETRRLRAGIREAVAAASRGEAHSQALPLPRREAEHPLLVRISALGRNIILGREVVVGQEVALLYLSDPDAPQEIITEHLQRLYGLTHREVLLATHLAGGLSLPQCQEAMGTSLNTLRTQLKSIFGKTGVNSQAALVRLVHAAPVWKMPPAVRRRHLRELAGDAA